MVHGDRGRLGWTALLGIFLLALALRAGWGTVHLVWAADPSALQFPDEQDYWSIAASIHHGEGLVGEHGYRALRMPLYPAFLALFSGGPNGVLQAKIAQWWISALAAVLAAMLTQRIAGRTTAVLAGLLVACDPFLVFFSSLLLAESLFVPVMLLLLLRGLRLLQPTQPARLRDWLLLGLLSAVAVYLRESSFLWCTAWTVFIVVGRKASWFSLGGGMVTLMVVVAALFPWYARNQRVTGEGTWLTNRAGISLYDGVGPQATGASNLGEVKQSADVRGLTEVQWNRHFLDAAYRAIRENPGRILRLAGVKLVRTWNPVPNVDTYQSAAVRAVSALWTIPVYAFALLGAFHLRRRDRAALGALLLPALCVCLMHAVFVGSVRYRLTAMPTLEILAAVGTVSLTRGRRGTLAQESPPPPTPGRSESPPRTRPRSDSGDTRS